ncbi:MAG TPA: hypothetical protein VMA83_08395 [Solirubrobacteraceae bacterium]|nr:hypothetical protein [Solirubrobacteraceae bacterium]
MNAVPAARQPDGVRRAAAGIFAAVAVVCVAAFLLTQRVKHLPTPIERFGVQPTLRVPGGRAHITVKPASAEPVSLHIVGSDERVAATPARRVHLAPGQALHVVWDGRTGRDGVRRVVRTPQEVSIGTLARGPLAPAGEYHIVVELLDKHRKITLPADLILERRR